MRSALKCIARFVGKKENGIDFDLVRDGRKARGRRWHRGALLMGTFLGLLALRKTFRGVERLTEHLVARRRLGIGRRIPDSTLAYFWGKHRDEAGLRKVLVSNVRALERKKALDPVRLPIHMLVIDGQTIWTGDKPVDDPACQKQTHEDGHTYYRIHVLHAVVVSAQSQPVIGQYFVPKHTNEIGAVPDFIAWLIKTYGRSPFLRELISFDAGMVSAKFAMDLDAENIGYLMAVKENQPALAEESRRLCGWGEHKQTSYVCEATTPWQHYQGKRIRRELYRSRDIEGWHSWQSARQVWRVKQTTEHPDGHCAVENRYFVTNLPYGRLSGDQILAVVRAHWGIENGCHWTLDVVMKQDTLEVCTTGRALRMLSWVRLLAYNVLRLLRDRYLRSKNHRSMPWAALGEWLLIALHTDSVWGNLRDEAAQATL
jgi:hypothetical protein